MSALDTTRIDHLLDNARARELVVTVAGLGSGGAPVVEQLTMCGVRRWCLFDPDTLDPVNLAKHPARRVDLGRLKVDITADWIRDRNPTAEIATHAEDIRHGDAFREAVAASDLVIGAVDNLGSRELINDVCVAARVPAVYGSVFRTGFGGEVYAYVPGATGCYACLEAFSEANGLVFEPEAPLTDVEKEQIYGLDDRTFQLSGLVADIHMIATLHAQLALAVLFGRPDAPIPPLTFNWLAFATRPHPPAFTSRFEARRVLLRPQTGCYAGCGEPAPADEA